MSCLKPISVTYQYYEQSLISCIKKYTYLYGVTSIVVCDLLMLKVKEYFCHNCVSIGLGESNQTTSRSSTATETTTTTSEERRDQVSELTLYNYNLLHKQHFTLCIIINGVYF